MYTRSDGSSKPSKVLINREGNVLETTFPSRFIHTLDGFEDASERVYTKMNLLLEQSEDTEVFLNILRKKSEKIRMEENQKPGET